jgi:hypothetical protein
LARFAGFTGPLALFAALTFWFWDWFWPGLKARTPADIKSDASATKTDEIFKRKFFVGLATYVTKRDEFGEGQLQRGIAMNECGKTLIYKLHGRGKPYGKRRIGRISALTFKRFATAATFARITSLTWSMEHANGAWIPERTGGNQSGLIHSIDRYDFFRHTYPHKEKSGCRPLGEAGAAPGCANDFRVGTRLGGSTKHDEVMEESSAEVVP